MIFFNKIKGTSFEEVFWTIKYGIPKRKATIYDLRESNFKELPNPVFFLSTGRAGTAWFSELISVDSSIKVLHNPTPTLASQSKLAFKYLSNGINADNKTLLKEIYLAGRENDLRYSYKTQKRLIETNNGISFFAPVLVELFPKAKFVHLVRDPIEFIYSGLKRDYFEGTSEDNRRITTETILDSWENSSAIVKIAWLWSATNKFISQFHSEHADRVFLFPFKNLTVEKVEELLTFLQINVPEKRIRNMIETPINAQKRGTFQSYEEWTKGEKEAVKELCEKLSNDLGFEFEHA